MKNWLKNVARNPKTTLTGVLGICAGVYAIVNNPAVLLDPVQAPVVLGVIVNGAGQVAGKDADKTGVAEKK